jgi:hypothetical protein
MKNTHDLALDRMCGIGTSWKPVDHHALIERIVAPEETVDKGFVDDCHLWACFSISVGERSPAYDPNSKGLEVVLAVA